MRVTPWSSLTKICLFRSDCQSYNFWARQEAKVPIVTATVQIEEKVDGIAGQSKANHVCFKLHAPLSRTLPPPFPGRSLEMSKFKREREQTLEELRQHNRNLALLNRVAQLLTSTLDIAEVIDQLVRTITELIDIEGSSVWLIDEKQRNYLVCAAIFSQGRNITPEHLSLPPGRGIAGWVVKHGKSATVADVSADPCFSSSIDQSTGFNTHSILAVPLRTPNKIVGVLELVNKRGGPFHENDRSLAETLAASAAIALENARLMQTLRQNRDELEARQ